ncbi:hypothetical protein [Actinophytocola sp.]|jgi:hypothetical protein|uniref:hypothetical protein n=1 Tax=Actinophytocola sp. TaxID=1872138 RepID=UPI002ED7B9E8
MDGISRDGAGIDMFPEETEAVMSQLGTAGAALHTAWQGKLGEIAALDSQLGRGPLGEAAERDYTPVVDNVVGNMNDLKSRVENKVDIGHRAVRLYVEQDRASKQNFDKT